ncbi:nuclear transport factor 2 family protein [Pseudarthrobacter sp. 1G09]|uniref:nuclear transport factor 2 family protein n=1 Tax=Pseudarthrobacter sp. 1G09 TaxID=3416178 RepID=UPI003CF7887D
MTTIPAGPVGDFINATNRHDADALLTVFAPSATVSDDGATYTGPTEIKEWIQEHQIAPRITLAPTSYTNMDDGAVVLTASADGEFPGGPLPFAFEFILDAGRIAALSIRFTN